MKSLSSIFQEFFARIGKILVLQGDCALGDHSMGFRHFSVPNFLSRSTTR